MTKVEVSIEEVNCIVIVTLIFMVHALIDSFLDMVVNFVFDFITV